jgi:hypothetical protein
LLHHKSLFDNFKLIGVRLLQHHTYIQRRAKKRETTVVWNNYNNQIKRILKNKKKMEVGRLKTNEERIS